MDLVRTFISADIPPIIQKSIQQQVDNLRSKIGDSSVRWVSVRNIHITLKFLGDVSQANADILTQIIRTEADAHHAFDINVTRLGSFPSPKRARVLYIGIQASAALDALQRGIESACARVGFSSESRPFSAHLTIGRVRQRILKSDQQKIYEILRDVEIDSLGIARVDSVHLYKSERKSSGAVYTKLFSAPLQN
ncbi:MAG TPA: RNA 2',3'-cyclic phosphodiesterase [Anaerolineales bacterium]|nr:RNA 2',3'-cyclic phosphodiesterase [Anaerolineales bacterium]